MEGLMLTLDVQIGLGLGLDENVRNQTEILFSFQIKSNNNLSWNINVWSIMDYII